tara:strand:+ start:432 stop:1787 length:1356 start_codon:yes stop_codon:yes gene_type:complete
MVKKRGNVEPFTLILFGSTGDLTKRKILPAMYELYKKGLDFNIVAIGRRTMSSDEYYAFASEFIKRDKGFKKRVSYFIADFQNEGQICLIPEYLNKNLKKSIICYLAVSPNYFSPIIKQLSKCGFVKKHHGSVRVVFEKPFGDNLKSARKLNKTIGKLFKEDQIYRIDHYLGKEAVQNLLVLRFANQLLESDWCNKYIEKVHIYAKESIGVGTRAGYYDKIGALKDMVQNHLMQILSLVAMEKPKDFSAAALRSEKLKVVKSLKLRNVKKQIVKGQYTGYLKEKNIALGSKTETYVGLKLEVHNKRWQGVPFYLETGKSLKEKKVGVDIYFKPVDNIFGFDIAPNIMEINIEPQGDINYLFNTKEIGHELKVRRVTMNFSSESEFGGKGMEAYEKLIFDISRGDQTLFTRSDEIEASWKLIDSISRKWKKFPLYKYKKGSLGPKEKGKVID